jgi:hypothetical protein
MALHNRISYIMFNGRVIVNELLRMWKNVVFKVLLWYLLVGTPIIL